MSESNVCKGTLVLPLEKSSFESFFCLASYLSPAALEKWRETYLHSAEFMEYENLVNSRRKHAYLLRNYCTKHAILRCLGKSLSYAKNLYIYNYITSQNILTSDRLYYARLQVNITHSETLGFAVAFEGLYPLGIDIERISIEKTQSIERLLSSHEENLIKTDIRENIITALWTAKEALCKALGGGLSVFSEVTVISEIFSYDNYKEVFFTHFPGYRAYCFSLDHYILTIAFPYYRRFQIDVNKIWEKLNMITNNQREEYGVKDRNQNYERSLLTYKLFSNQKLSPIKS